MKFKSESNLRETARTALARLESIQLKASRNPFSKRGPIAGLFRSRKAVRLERAAGKLLPFGSSGSSDLFFRAYNKEKMPFFHSALGISYSRAKLLTVASGEYGAMGAQQISLVSEFLSNIAYDMQAHDARVSVQLYAVAGGIYLALGQYSAAGSQFSRAVNRSQLSGMEPSVSALMQERRADALFGSGKFTPALEEYAKALTILSDSPGSSVLKPGIYAKMAECQFSQGNWEVGREFLIRSGRDEVSSGKEADGRRALAEGSYQDAVSALDNALMSQKDADTVMGLALEYSSLLAARAREIRSGLDADPKAGSDYAKGIALLNEYAADFLESAANRLEKIYPNGASDLRARALVLKPGTPQ